MPEEEYARGHAAGEVSAQIADHAAHLSKINGSMADAANALTALVTEVALMRAEEKAARVAEEEGRIKVAIRARNVTIAISIVLMILTVVSFLRGSPFG